MGVGRDITSALDPVLVAAGFAAGQGVGVEDDRGAPAGITYCTGHDKFSDRFPWMPQADGYPRGDGLCLDLVIEANAKGVIKRIDLESFSLAETLLLAGHVEESRAVAHFIGQASAEVVEYLPGILERLFQEGQRSLRDRR